MTCRQATCQPLILVSFHYMYTQSSDIIAHICQFHRKEFQLLKINHWFNRSSFTSNRAKESGWLHPQTDFPVVSCTSMQSNTNSRHCEHLITDSHNSWRYIRICSQDRRHTCFFDLLPMHATFKGGGTYYDHILLTCSLLKITHNHHLLKMLQWKTTTTTTRVWPDTRQVQARHRPDRFRGCSVDLILR